MWLPSFAVPTWIAADAWTRHLAARLGASVAAAALLVALPQALPAIAAWTDAGCLLQRIAGMRCPGCGITTSLLAIAGGDVMASWRANPAGLGVAALLAGQALIAGVALVHGADGGRGRSWLDRLDRLAIGGLLAIWIGRLIGAVS